MRSGGDRDWLRHSKLLVVAGLCIGSPAGGGPLPLPRMKVTLNRSIESLSGKLDDWVYRRVGDQVIVAARADPTTKKASTKQQAGRQRFADARAYAKEVMADPRKREIYVRLGQLAGRQPDKLLTSDFLTPPEITQVDLSDYRGQAGDPIYVFAFDDIEVVSVEVALQNAAGAAWETGAAGADHGVWCYRPRAAAPAGERISVVVTARDRPGNATSVTVQRA